MSSPLRRSIRVISRFAVALAALVALGTSLVTVLAVPGDFGPQIAIDKVVAERGAPVNVTLTGFMANQQVTIVVSAASDAYQGTAAATLPVSLDSTGTGFASIATSGLATGDYVVNAVGPGGLQLSVPTAFGVISPGTLGPRVVRVAPAPDEG